MSIIKKILQYSVLDRELFRKIESMSPLTGGNKSPAENEEPAASGAMESPRFWFYAESLGEFRIAMFIADILREIYLKRKNGPKPVFFIGFKTNSAFILASNMSKESPDDFKDVVFFFHPLLAIKPVLRKYVKAIRPDYFIMVEHLIAPLLANELIDFGAGLFLLDIDKSNRKSCGKFFKDINIKKIKKGKSIKASVMTGDEKEMFEQCLANISNKNILEIGDTFKATVIPFRLKQGIFKIKELQTQTYHVDSGAKVFSFISVHRNESRFILRIMKELLSTKKIKNEGDLKFIIAPRNLKLSGQIFKTAKDYNLKPIYIKQIDNIKDDFLNNESAVCLIVNDYGVLDKIYAVSDMVFVGKSLFKEERGGHNILEPASFGKAVITGHYADNFNGIITDMLKYNAITEVNQGNFIDTLFEFANNPNLMRELGDNALKYFSEKKDAAKNAFFKYFDDNVDTVNNVDIANKVS